LTIQELKTLASSADQQAEWARMKGEISSARCWESISQSAAELVRLRTQPKNPALV
jgi:hypothetical protein